MSSSKQKTLLRSFYIFRLAPKLVPVLDRPWESVSSIGWLERALSEPRHVAFFFLLCAGSFRGRTSANAFDTSAVIALAVIGV